MKQGALIGPIIIAIGLICAALAFALVGAVLQTADGATELRLDRAEAQIESLERDIADTRDQLAEAEQTLNEQAEELAILSGQLHSGIARQPGSSIQLPVSDSDAALPIAPLDLEDHIQTEEPTEVMILAKARFNKGITQPRNRTMLEILGQPRGQYGTTCQSITNPKLSALVETRTVGPIRVTMLKPALDSLQRIVDRLKESEPDLYEGLGTAGGLCVRLIRGSNRSVSNHSFGTAIDVKLDGKLDGFGDGGTQFGLLLLAELFNEEGWYWGATYRREDSMHFEVGEETLRKWRSEGRI